MPGSSTCARELHLGFRDLGTSLPLELLGLGFGGWGLLSPGCRALTCTVVFVAPCMPVLSENMGTCAPEA